MKSAAICKFSLMAVVVLCLAATIASVGLMPRSAGAQPGAGVQIESVQWLEAKYEGFDSFYGQDIVAYEASTTGSVVAKVYNHTNDEVTIDYARLEFGWGGNPIEATSKPATIAKTSYVLIAWDVPVQSTTVASNLIVHTWTMALRWHVGDSATSTDEETGGSDFVVYAADQSACRDSVDTWNANNEAYTIWGYKGREMMTEALSLYNKAEDQYNSGDFENAKANYAEAVTKQDEAIKADAKCALTDQSAQALQGTGGTKGIGYLIAGIGILLAGIGVMVGALLWVMRGKKPA
jgi:hypothetical protein